MSREGKLVKNTMILSIGTFLPKLASFITLPILTECLTKDEYGTYDLIIVLVSLFLPAVTLQIQTAAFRFLIDVRENEEKTKEAFKYDNKVIIEKAPDMRRIHLKSGASLIKRKTAEGKGTLPAFTCTDYG